MNGDGARFYGGRWNSPGRPVVYTSSTTSLAALEMLAHLSKATVPSDLVIHEIEVPPALLPIPAFLGALPSGWQQPGCTACRAAGDAWLAARTSAILAVPSAVIVTEFNYLLNPLHPDFALLTIGPAVPFAYDSRLVP